MSDERQHDDLSRLNASVGFIAVALIFVVISLLLISTRLHQIAEALQ